MKKTTALTVTVLAIATVVGTSVTQSAYSFAQAPTSSLAQAKSSWENPKLVHTLPTIASYAKFSSNGLLLVCNGERGKAIQLWDVTKGEYSHLSKATIPLTLEMLPSALMDSLLPASSTRKLINQ